MGAKDKLTPKVRQNLLMYAKRGHSIARCACLSGIPDSTMRGWLDAGKANANPKMAKFYRDYMKACGQMADLALQNIEREIEVKKNPEMSQWWIEKKEGLGKLEEVAILPINIQIMNVSELQQNVQARSQRFLEKFAPPTIIDITEEDSED